MNAVLHSRVQGTRPGLASPQSLLRARMVLRSWSGTLHWPAWRARKQHKCGLAGSCPEQAGNACQLHCRKVTTGGGDGCINVWQLDAHGSLGARLACVPLFLPEASSLQGPPAPPMITALDVVPGSRGKAYLVGTAQCDLWRVEEGCAADMAMFGHSATLHSVAANPRREFGHVFATVSDASRAVVWSATTKQVRGGSHNNIMGLHLRCVCTTNHRRLVHAAMNHTCCML